MRHSGVRNLVFMAAAGLAIAACDTIRQATGGDGADGASAEAVVPASAAPDAPVGADVEAPEAYQATDKALWDGRPSLGGVWVASPDVKDPERVKMVNPSNGKSVVGALFRRERENPGPRLQLSSDAAEALGLLAGQPATIRVTALRRKEAPASAEAPAPQATPGAAAPAAARPAAAATPAPPAATAAAAASATGGRSIRVGTFSREENARRAADQLAKDGVAARVAEAKQGDKSLWSVVAGPAAPADAPALLSRIKGLGFDDAYLLAR
ncbi:SPOR domain-containing protein [Rhodobacter sp. NSM]|uniref:SPOR domain-containing protein n=1 Tax=Rhodobacter sp. NSM TaxID=3457501 RepID=UPI003FD1F9E5